MGLFSKVLDLLAHAQPPKAGGKVGFLPYGGNKEDGSHDHRFNRGNDRTPAQKAGDDKRRK